MFANLSWSSGLIADGTGSELARAVGHPDVFSAPAICHVPYAICHIPYFIFHIPYTCIGNNHHKAQICCATKATVERGVVTVG